MTHKQSHYPWYIRLMFWMQEKRYGQVLRSAEIWAKVPRVFLAQSWLYHSLDGKHSSIPPSLRSLIIVRVSQLNGCSFCIDLNTSILLERGVSLEKVRALAHWQESPLFDEREKQVLEYAEAVTHSHAEIDEGLRQKMAALYSPQELVEITGLIAFQNMSTKFNNAFGVKPQGFCHIGIHSPRRP